MTRIERILAGTVKETISFRTHCLKPYSKEALAPSVAKPLPQYCDPKRQPTSTVGVKWDFQSVSLRPIKPINS